MNANVLKIKHFSSPLIKCVMCALLLLPMTAAARPAPSPSASRSLLHVAVNPAIALETALAIEEHQTRQLLGPARKKEVKAAWKNWNVGMPVVLPAEWATALDID